MGALTSKSYTFQARIWEISSYELSDTSDSLLVPIFANFRGTEFLRILPKVRAGSTVFSEWISDRTRFSYYSYKYQRLSRPLYRFTSSTNFAPVSWRFAMSLLVAQLACKANYQHFYLGSRLDLQTCFALHRLLSFFKPYRYACYLSVVPVGFSIYGLEASDFFIELSSSYFSSIRSVCFFGYDFNSALPLLDFEFSKSFFSSECDVFTIGSNNSFISYPVTSLGLSNCSFLTFLRGKSRFARFVSKKTNLVLYFSLAAFDFFALSVFNFSKTFLSRVLNFYYSFKLSQIIISPYSTTLNFFNIFDSLTLQSFKTSRHSSRFLHYFIGSESVCPQNLKKRDFVVYQGSNYSEVIKISNLVLPVLFPLEDAVTNINLFGKKISSAGFPLLPGSSFCFSNSDVFFNFLSFFANIQFSLNVHNGQNFDHYKLYEEYCDSPTCFPVSSSNFQFSPQSVFPFTSPISFFYYDVISQLSAPLSLQVKILLKSRSYLSFF